jgi:hypothetical protein
MDRELAHPDYYAAENKLYAKLNATTVSLGTAAHIAAALLEAIGERPCRFVLGRVERNFDRFDKTSRTIEFNPPAVPLLSIVHEVAHVLHWEHGDAHACAVALLVEILKELKL